MISKVMYQEQNHVLKQYAECSNKTITISRNGWGDDMKNHMLLKTTAELLALAGHINRHIVEEIFERENII